jgi:sulfiredoxin
MPMMQSVPVKVDTIYVPARMRSTLDATKVDSLATSIAEKGLQTPIHVRADKERYVLVSGFHRLEAVRKLGEATIQALIVRTPLR